MHGDALLRVANGHGVAGRLVGLLGQQVFLVDPGGLARTTALDDDVNDAVSHREAAAKPYALWMS
jgi:hypothetical protein